MFLEFDAHGKKLLLDMQWIIAVEEHDATTCTIVLSNGDEYIVTNSYSDIRSALFRNEEDWAMFIVLTDTSSNEVTVNTDHIVTVRPNSLDENTATVFLVTGSLINVQGSYENISAFLTKYGNLSAYN